MVRLNDVLVSMETNKISFILIGYDFLEEDRDLAILFINHLNRCKQIETAKVFFDPIQGEVEELFCDIANYKLD